MVGFTLRGCIAFNVVRKKFSFSIEEKLFLLTVIIIDFTTNTLRKLVMLSSREVKEEREAKLASEYSMINDY